MYAPTAKVTSGNPELDNLLRGGFPRHRICLVEGAPGSGKTTLAFQFLLDGARRGEVGLYVTFSETRDELEEVAESHGWSLEGIQLLELSSLKEKFLPEQQYTIFHPADVELSETTQRVIDEVNRVKPTRLVVDSLSEIRLIAREPLRYRRQILALKELLSTCGCTVLFLEHRPHAWMGHQANCARVALGLLLYGPVQFLDRRVRGELVS